MWCMMSQCAKYLSVCEKKTEQGEKPCWLRSWLLPLVEETWLLVRAHGPGLLASTHLCAFVWMCSFWCWLSCLSSNPTCYFNCCNNLSISYAVIDLHGRYDLSVHVQWTSEILLAITLTLSIYTLLMLSNVVIFTPYLDSIKPLGWMVCKLSYHPGKSARCFYLRPIESIRVPSPITGFKCREN